MALLRRVALGGVAVWLTMASSAMVPAAPVDPETPACKMIPGDALKPLLGEPVVIRETNKATEGVSNCFWKGAKDSADVGLHYITFASQKVQGGTALDYFRQNEQSRKQRGGQDNYKPAEGIGQAAFMFDPPNNPTQAVTIYFLQNDDTVTLETYGIGAPAALALAKSIAESMRR